ncbi:MAG: hypothetical protein DI530_12235 [Sphingomonas sp.]|uniref:hypothetical protein n=1 Tax=Sphingomonas sp. TaxID=28214 RepID=UPI000DBC2B5A|nr:hypothetical protein [Sphingomonas sp.]PZU77753.1 MAG: hypothetical protein DI530_12235 [Sphingomonas sp.]
MDDLTITEAGAALGVSWRRELQPLMVRLGWLVNVGRGSLVTAHGAVAAGYVRPITQLRNLGAGERTQVNAEVGFRITPAGMIVLRRAARLK